jgi:hypothetical protein
MGRVTSGANNETDDEKQAGAQGAVPMRWGPWDGYALALDADAGCRTAWFALHGLIGRYVEGRWEAAQ